MLSLQRLMKLNFTKDDKRNIRKETSVRRCDRCGVHAGRLWVCIVHDDYDAYVQEYRFRVGVDSHRINCCGGITGCNCADIGTS